ncbi:MAG: methyltransferase domain-containing protein [Erysipelotrichaceae bacterium]|nr:methyltransferase domain-containing protein [Erysipelotrichaceae bacterium]
MEIRCPICKDVLHKNENTYKCIHGHSFDIAKEGYVNLYLHKSETSGDNKEMIQARRNFLNQDHYRFLLDELNKYIDENDVLVDLACGEGYYTSKFRCKDRTGIDLSKQGLRYASKSDKDTTYILSSIFDVPLYDNCADKALTIFAPIAKEEIDRILKEDGRFILVRPDEDHLFEMKEVLYEKPYRNETEDIMIDGLVQEKQLKIHQKAILNKEELHDLFLMTPYSNTTSLSDKKKLDSCEELSVTFAFIIDIYKKA